MVAVIGIVRALSGRFWLERPRLFWKRSRKKEKRMERDHDKEHRGGEKGDGKDRVGEKDRDNDGLDEGGKSSDERRQRVVEGLDNA